MIYKTLINFSGGIDSLWCLWDYARRREPLLVHYCHLVNWTGRGDHELKAVQNALAWIDEYEPFDYKLIMTRFDYGNMRIVQDKEVIGFLSGIILRDNRYPLQNLIISSNAQDVERMPYYIRSEADRLRLLEGVGRRRLRYLYPIMGKTKEQLMRELPRDLLDLAWFCRTPSKQGYPCGRCQTCTKVLPILDNLETRRQTAVAQPAIATINADPISARNHE